MSTDISVDITHSKQDPDIVKLITCPLIKLQFYLG